MKFLFIDDNGEWLRAIKRIFGEENVVMAECHSIEEALVAIVKHDPDVIFLDHSLTDGGNEGFEVAGKAAEGIKIYSTTANNAIAKEYLKRGIEHVGKTDLEKFESIIE